jgi:hypothetical protein
MSFTIRWDMDFPGVDSAAADFVVVADSMAAVDGASVEAASR